MKFIKVPLKTGANEIMVEGFWGYMSMDYLAIAVKDNTLNTRYDENVRNAPLLEQNFPNPFHTETNIVFTLPERGHAIVEIVDLSGKKVEVIIDRSLDAGRHAIRYRPVDTGSGFYLIRLNYQGILIQRKMVLL